MRRMTLIRCGVATVLLGSVVAVGAFASGCGGDDNGTTPGGDDGGPDATQMQPPPGGDDGGGDGSPGSNPDGGASADGYVAPAPVHGKLILVHASAFAPALRFCFGSVVTPDGGDAGTVTVTPSYPAPNTALGVPPGTGGPAADTSVDLASRTLEIYAINSAAAGLAGQLPDAGSAELTCDKLIGDKALAADAGGPASPLALGSDYWDLGQLPAGTLADGTTTLLAVTGCAPGQTDTDNALVQCPTGYNPAVGDLAMWATKLDTTTTLDAGSIGAQFAYASYPFSFVSAAKGGASAVAGFYLNTTFTPDASAPVDAGDAGDAAVEAAAPTPVPVTIPFPVAEGVGYGTLAPTTLVPIQGITFDGTSGFFVNSVTADGGPTFVAPGIPLNVGIPLPGIQAVSAPTADGGIFANGVGYVFVLVGDPTQPSYNIPDGGDAGPFNLFSAHILGFPTNPPFGN
jgi:hypothetical protein